MAGIQVEEFNCLTPFLTVQSRLCGRRVADNPEPIRRGMVVSGVASTLDEVQVPKVNLILAAIVKWFHVSVVIFTATGWMLPWPNAWILLLALVPAMKMHWLTNEGVCFFTTLERKLRCDPLAGTSAQAGFMHRISVAILGNRSPSEKVVTTLAEIGMYIGFIIAAARLFIL